MHWALLFLCGPKSWLYHYMESSGPIPSSPGSKLFPSFFRALACRTCAKSNAFLLERSSITRQSFCFKKEDKNTLHPKRSFSLRTNDHHHMLYISPTHSINTTLIDRSYFLLTSLSRGFSKLRKQAKRRGRPGSSLFFFLVFAIHGGPFGWCGLSMKRAPE